jgi:chaperonin GroES
MTEVLSGKSPGTNVPATTTLALIEQGLQVYSAVHKRVHRSLYQEFKKLRRLNVLYLPDEAYSDVLDDPEAIRRRDYESSDHDIIPVSDPNATTNMQRIMKAKALLEIKGQGLNDKEINKRYLQALQVEDIDKLIPEEDEDDPILELEIQTKQAGLDKIIAEQSKVEAETQLIFEKIQTEQVEQDVKRAGVAFDKEKLRLEKAEILAKIEDSERRLKIKDVENSEVGGKSDKTKVQGPMREKGLASNNQE